MAAVIREPWDQLSQEEKTLGYVWGAGFGITSALLVKTALNRDLPVVVRALALPAAVGSGVLSAICTLGSALIEVEEV